MITHKKYNGSMITLLAAFVFAALSSCGQIGDTCYSYGGIVDECFTAWTPEECQYWNSLQVNGATWASSLSDCPGLGFSVQCSSTHYAKTSSACP